MKRTLPLAALFLPIAVNAQLTVTTGLTPAQLTNLLEGLNVSISNLTINCPDTSFGQFSGTSEIPIANGLVLTTGIATAVAGPVNNTASMPTSMVGDPDLQALVSAPTFDACVLEFDCVPLGDTLLFNFVFGSEEYPEFVGGAFNDVFAIWSTGPGFPIPTNVAAIPGGMPVSINNVNATTNPAYFVDNAAIPGVNCTYDGFTQNLTAFAEVTPGGTYHFKIGIADAGDGIFDSGVFLEAFSFRSMLDATAISAAVGSDLKVIDQNGLLEITLPAGRTVMNGHVFDVSGRVVRSFTVVGGRQSIALTDLRAGRYDLELSDAQGVLHQAFLHRP